MRWLWKNKFGFLVIALVTATTLFLVNRFRKPGQLDVMEAQAMDMSQMRPPAGAIPVDLAAVRQSSLSNTVTYTGSIKAYNEQDISARVTGTITTLPVYPGDAVRAGQLVAQLDTAELSARAQSAQDQARQTEVAEDVARLTSHTHHTAAIDQAMAQKQVADAGVADAQAQEEQARAAISDAQAGVAGAQANSEYWKTEITREKQLLDAGAVSRQEYQNELAQAQAAAAALVQAQSKVAQARSALVSAQAKERGARRLVSVANTGIRMAQADQIVATGQILQQHASADAARSSAREAAVVAGYTRIISPASGVVTERPIAPGTLVQPGTTILKIAEIDRVRVQANVAVADLDGIAAGAPVTITAGSRPAIHTHVTSVFPSASADTRTAVVEAVVSNPRHSLLPGAFVTLKIAKARAGDTLTVPSEAIVRQGGESFVWNARKAGSAALQYRATGCGQLYSAADAKKYHYICPMEGSKLLPVKQTEAPSKAITAHRIVVREGGSDGVRTEIESPDLQPSDQVVRHGQADLVEGAPLAPTPWGPDGPLTLPTAAQADSGRKVYRCEKCGMTYSEADAKKYNFVDPMDGGKLVAQ